MMNNKNIISDFKEIYLRKTSNLEIGGNITILAHKDIVGFFVLKKNNDFEYILYKYGNISNDYIVNIKSLFSKIYGEVKIKVVDFIDKYIVVNCNQDLKEDDFLMYPPNYYVKNGFIYGPYLDNLLSIYVFNILSQKENYNLNFYQSFDEEAKLTYFKSPRSNYNIVLDTIRQDYLDDDIDLDTVYNVESTKFSDSLQNLNINGIKNIKLNLNFKLEIDMIENGIKYFLACPIRNGHCAISSVKLNTINQFINSLDLLIKIIKGKKS